MTETRRPRSRRRRNAGGGPRRQLEDQKIFFKMRAILKLMRKQELMFKRITKLMREIIDLHDFSADLQMLTGDLGAMDLQTVTEIKTL